MLTSTSQRANTDREKATASKLAVREIVNLAWFLLGTRRTLFCSGLLLLLVNRACGLVIPVSTRFIIDDIIGKQELRMVPWIVAVLLGVIGVQAATGWGMSQILAKGGQRMIAELRIRIQSHVGMLPISFYDQSRVGELVSRIMSDVEGVRNLIGSGVVEFLGNITTAFLALAILFQLSHRMALMVAIFAVAYIGSLSKLLRLIWPISMERSQVLAELTGRLTESLGGVRVVKGFNAERFEEGQFARGIKNLLQNLMRAITMEGRLTLVSQITGSLLGLGVIYLGVHMVIAKQLTLGGYLTCSLLMSYILSPLTTAVSAGLQLTDAGVGIQRALNILQQEREVDQPERVLELSEVQGKIAFEDVSFAYDLGNPVLHEITFEADSNQTIALVGPSGAGKSTVTNLICGFYVPQQGKVTIDGIDLAAVKLESYRRHIGVVLQDSFLFHGTIRENVMFARPEATEEEVVAACRDAHVNEFAERFPNKYETIVGERGVRLSGGQKQRVSIARALLANPRILILDEATSNLDLESEHLIQAALGKLMQQRTTIVIAHRLSTIKRADQILVLDRGRIIERGTHDNLYATPSRYRGLYDLEFSAEKKSETSRWTADGTAVN